MRNRNLHGRLRAFAEEAAYELTADAAEAEELPFEVVESPGARAPLYCYRPLTEQFIHERRGLLARLPTHGAAAAALSSLSGVDEYLRLRGEVQVPADRGDRAREALSVFLAALYHERTEFDFCPERFDRAYAELEAAVYESRTLTAVIAPVHGLALASEELALDDDLSLVRADGLDGVPPEAAWSGPRPADAPNVLALVTLEGQGGERAVEIARRRFARLLTALRLADAGEFDLSPAGWTRTDAGAWTLVATGGALPARVRAEPFLVTPDQEDELRGFCNLVARRADALGPGELAWALTRFEAGCERADPMQALTDHLLALRALLEPEGPASGRMAQRLAAICATPAERPALAERVAHAISLERAVVAGLPPATGSASELVADVAHHLRSLLRDVLCGHLEADLVGVADALLADAITGETPAVREEADEDSTQDTAETAVPALFASTR
jgi:hypothetical protein